MKIISIKEELQVVCETFGGSSHWFQGHTLVIISGCRPKLGYGFRAIFCYSKHSNREMTCDSLVCIIEQTTGNVAWVQCYNCSGNKICSFLNLVLRGGGDYYYEWSRVVWGAGSVVFGLGQLLVAANKNRVYIFSFYLGWFHNFCDPLIRKRSTVLRASEVYKCQNCRQKMQDT